jgi:hypothetical protein
MRSWISSLLIACSFWAFSQQKQTVSGIVRDAQTGEELVGAVIKVADTSGLGTVTNSYGFFSLTLPKGKNTLIVGYVGYSEQSISVLNDSKLLEVKLAPVSKELQTIEISARKADENVRSAAVSAVRLDIKELEKIPVLFGEKDLLKTIQLLPGVQAASDGNSGYFVRGGSNDQNLILLDEAVVYNASHLLGFFSTFNNDAIKDAMLYKGNMPAEFGGRLSSVLDVKMKEGNNQNYVLSGGIGLIASRLNVEGPIVRDKGSFLITGRRTYADLFLKLSRNQELRNNRLFFYDLNAKANYKFGKRDRLFVSGYFGEDVFSFSERFSIQYGNATATVRWNHIFSDKFFSNTSFVYNDFHYSIGINTGNIDVKSIVRDFSLKEDAEWFINSNNKIKFGLLSTFHSMVPGEIFSKDTARINNIKLTKNYGWENALYAQHETNLWNKLNIHYGLRLSLFSQVGPGNYYKFPGKNEVDTFRLPPGKFGSNYFNAEPRFALSYNFFPKMSFKTAYSRNVQNIHLLSNTTTSFPTDRWILTSNNVKPEISDQVSAGYFVNFFNNMFELSVEGYFKWMQNQIDYKNGAILRANETVESQLLYGVGRSYGGEFYFRKKTGKFTGWISYTLSRSERRFAEINRNNWFPARFDRTHDLSIVAIYDITPRIHVSATWVFFTGNAVTYPVGIYFVNGTPTPLYGDRNQNRFPDYHRLDLGATFILKKRKNWEHDLNVSVYNVYARKNVFAIDFKVDERGALYAEKTYLFRIVPSVTYNFKFVMPPLQIRKKN